MKDMISSASNASSSLDPLPTKIVKSSLDILLSFITLLINCSLSAGKVPSIFKTAIVTPLIKKHNLDKNIFKNYRPVSNLSFISKLIEKAVSLQLRDHFLENDFFEKFQSAYRTGHSTETALLRVLNDLLIAVDQGQVVILLLLDLSAAFDTIDHSILFFILHSMFGVSGTVLEWIKSYLSNRSQSVRVDQTTSAPSSLKYGVPQGSILGPLLFCIYMIPLAQIIRRHNMRLHIYADDTQLYCTFKPKAMNTREEAVKSAELCVDDIRSWMSAAKLKLNTDKTELLVVSSTHAKQFVEDFALRVGDTLVSSSESCRNLGVIFDRCLNMRKHVANVCRSSYFHLRSIGSIRKYLTEEACAQLLHAFVTSKLDYCNSLLVNLPSVLLSKIQRVQNTAARILTLSRRSDHITPVLIRLHWLPIRLRIHYKFLLLIYKCLQTGEPAYLCELLVPYTPSRSLRSSNQGLLKPVRHRLQTYGNRAFEVNAPVLWNNLPLDIRCTETLLAYKSKLKTYLFTCFTKSPSNFM